MLKIKNHKKTILQGLKTNDYIIAKHLLHSKTLKISL